MDQTIKAALVGCGGMGKSQAAIIKNHPDYQLVAVCDVAEAAAKAVAEEHGVKPYTDFEKMLETEKPAVVAIPTSTASHAPLTLAAARFDCVKGIYCEKPMATNLKNARQMVQACRDKQIALVINHQRRVGPDLVKAKELIDHGAIGEVKVLRGHCAGDFLSDGTHLCDSLMFLAGDPEVHWIVGQIVRDIDALREKWKRMNREEPAEGFGYRFGHPVESGAMAVAQLANGMRAEFFTGDLQQSGRIYQDYVIEGTEGQIWRLGDRTKPHNLYLLKPGGGQHVQDSNLQATPAPDGRGIWEPIEYAPDGNSKMNIHRGFSLLAETLRSGKTHPMSGDVALNAFNIVMGVYESARQNKRLYPPFDVDRFPLEAMIEEGRA